MIDKRSYETILDLEERKEKKTDFDGHAYYEDSYFCKRCDTDLTSVIKGDWISGQKIELNFCPTCGNSLIIKD